MLWPNWGTYVFTVSGVSVSPSVGDTYNAPTNAGGTFVVTVTAVSISGGSGTITGTGSPGRSGVAPSGNLTVITGGGDATIAYASVAFTAGKRDYQYLCNYSSSGLTHWTTEESELQETWGNSASTGNEFRLELSQGKPLGTYKLTATVSGPNAGWSWTNTYTPGLYSTAYLRAYWAGVIFEVSAGSWSLSWTTFTVYLSLNGGSETTVFTAGSGSLSGSGYMECLNDTSLSGSGGPLSPPCITYVPIPGTPCPITASGYTQSVGTSGGYEWGPVGGPLSPDPVELDASSTPGSCTNCAGTLPSLSGPDTYHVSVSASEIYSSAVVATGTQSCPGCTPSSFTWEQWLINSTTESSSVQIKASNIPTQGLAESLTTSWSCYEDPGGETSGGSTTGLSIPPFVSPSARYVNVSGLTIYCNTSLLPACPPPPPTYPCGYPGPNTSCCFTATAVVGCSAIPFGSRPKGYDVSGSMRHCRTYIDTATNTFWLGIADNLVPSTHTWNNTDSGTLATWARPRYATVSGVTCIKAMYGDGAQAYLTTTLDEGHTYTSPTSLGSAELGDFTIAANGTQWLFKVEDDSGTYNVYNQLVDANNNVIRSWTITTITNIDNSGIAVRDSVGQIGGSGAPASWRVGVFFSVGGTPTVRYSSDGINFA